MLYTTCLDSKQAGWAFDVLRRTLVVVLGAVARAALVLLRPLPPPVLADAGALLAAAGDQARVGRVGTLERPVLIKKLQCRRRPLQIINPYPKVVLVPLLDRVHMPVVGQVPVAEDAVEEGVDLGLAGRRHLSPLGSKRELTA